MFLECNQVCKERQERREREREREKSASTWGDGSWPSSQASADDPRRDWMERRRKKSSGEQRGRLQKLDEVLRRLLGGQV